jgi:hypothetical protein
MKRRSVGCWWGGRVRTIVVVTFAIDRINPPLQVMGLNNKIDRNLESVGVPLVGTLIDAG